MEGDLAGKVEDAVAGLLAGLRLETVEVRVSGGGGRLTVRISVNKEGGVTVDDCAEASELIGQVLEREGTIPGPYVLEVMSPGVDRPLKGPEDYRRSVGKRVRVRLRQPFEGEGGYTGILRQADGERFALDVGGDRIELSYEAIAGARLDPELPW
ncbi:MAG: ribosome maturation factor RimP [Actinomycetota bacterium]